MNIIINIMIFILTPEADPSPAASGSRPKASSSVTGVEESPPPGGVPVVMPVVTPGDIPDAIPGGISGVMPDGMPVVTPGVMSDGVPLGCPGGGRCSKRHVATFHEKSMSVVTSRSKTPRLKGTSRENSANIQGTFTEGTFKEHSGNIQFELSGRP
jgi:hypothetical protein